MRLEAQFVEEPAYRHVGLQLEQLSCGICVSKTRVTDALLHHRGAVQGGIVAMIADATAGYAALSSLPSTASKDDMATIEFKTSFFLPCFADDLICHSEVIHAGNRTFFCTAKVYLDRVDKTRLCSESSLTFTRLRAK